MGTLEGRPPLGGCADGCRWCQCQKPTHCHGCGAEYEPKRWFHPSMTPSGWFRITTSPGCDPWNYGLHASTLDRAECVAKCQKLNSKRLEEAHQVMVKAQEEYDLATREFAQIDYSDEGAMVPRARCR